MFQCKDFLPVCHWSVEVWHCETVEIWDHYGSIAELLLLLEMLLLLKLLLLWWWLCLVAVDLLLLELLLLLLK